MKNIDKYKFVCTSKHTINIMFFYTKKENERNREYTINQD